MKRILLVLVSTLFFCATASAAYGPAGCGAGAMIMKDKSGLIYNVMAATTNGLFGNQTFGMSSGTLGCDGEAAVMGSISFIKNNIAALSNDVSKGEGPTLDAYLTLINAQNTDVIVLKSNFASIFAPSNSAEQIHNLIADLI